MAEFDGQGKPLKKVVILQASTAVQLEQMIMNAIQEGYGIYGQMKLADGTFYQMMVIGPKTVRTGM